ncbi:MULTISPECIES: cytoplasmic protein [Sphingomonas]|uniref:cytoplasmic protein n=1 Tax=Sphingomonas TaxID=13687 RepID=UPI000F7D667B|nr:cytoplasmic protein [Sphingomonas sp. ABOLF]RSV13714.1 cytoplasmic protein [Sphingomonas sp. ABOLF]
MEYDPQALDAAHRHSRDHREQLERSGVCGCFYCQATFMTASIDEWLEDEGGTALCPQCGVDSVIGSASGYPVEDRSFLSSMHTRWFD